MNDNEIKQILGNIEVQPAPRCWEAIKGALGAAGSTSTAATKAAAQATRHLSGTAVKTIIAVSVTSVVAAGALVSALLLSHPDETTTTPSATASETGITPPQSDATNSLTDTSATANTPTLSKRSTSITHEDTAENTLTGNPAIPAITETTTPTEDVKTPAAATTRPADLPSTLSQNNNSQQEAITTQSASSSPEPSASTPQPIPQTEDPVLAGRDDIEFSQPVAIEIPNVFTPNGDGYNDLFTIKGIEHCEKNKLIIRSRSGSVILQTNDYQNNWDAQNAPDGTYFYQFYYTIHGIEEVRTGTLVIMR